MNSDSIGVSTYPPTYAAYRVSLTRQFQHVHLQAVYSMYYSLCFEHNPCFRTVTDHQGTQETNPILQFGTNIRVVPEKTFDKGRAVYSYMFKRCQTGVKPKYLS